MNLRSITQEFFIFGIKQARASIFAGSFFALLFLSNQIPLFGLARYDFLFLAAIALQIILVATKIETKDEVKTIFLFHLIGLALELFKTHPAIGSWAYPEAAFFKIGSVPLYSGFMYAAVASYIMQAWRLFDMKLTGYPLYRFSIPISAAVYFNFFTHHYMYDFRWVLAVIVVIVFWKTSVFYTPHKNERRMPLILSFGLIGFFIWIAENISTYFGAWQYPDQIHEWSVVSFGKISSWMLLVIISFIIVANLKHLKQNRTPVTYPQGRLPDLPQ